MRTVAISRVSQIDTNEARFIKMLRDNGFGTKVIENERFARGNANESKEIELLNGACAVIAAGERYPKAVTDALPGLRVIARLGVGFDRVDIPAATSNNVVVTITPNSNHEAVAEHALALMLAVSKSIVVRDRHMRKNLWLSEPSLPLRGRTLGIIGLGRIGSDLAIRARAFSMKIIAVEPYANERFLEENNIEIVDIDTLLVNSDFVSLHCDLSEDTKGLIDRHKLQLMSKNSILINTARGGLVVEPDLVEALQSKQILGAGLDVFELEPCKPDNPLYGMEQVVLSPHMAAVDSLSLEDMSIEAAQCIIDLHKGNWPEQCVVNRELKDNWVW